MVLFAANCISGSLTCNVATLIVTNEPITDKLPVTDKFRNEASPPVIVVLTEEFPIDNVLAPEGNTLKLNPLDTAAIPPLITYEVLLIAVLPVVFRILKVGIVVIAAPPTIIEVGDILTVAVELAKENALYE